MMKRLFSILLIFAFAFHIQCFAISSINEKIISFETFSNADGLSNNNIRCIFQDSKGFIWIGTNSGLNRYDGKNFVIFKNDPQNPNSLSSNSIYGITEDAAKNIWVATEYGINVISRENYECRRFSVNVNTEKDAEKNLIQNIFCDSENNLWIKKINSIECYNLQTKKMRSYPLMSDIFQEEFDHYAYPIFQDSQGILWIGTDNGLGYYEPVNDDFIFFKSDAVLPHFLSDNRVLSIYEDDMRRLWIGTQNGLNLFDKKNKKFTSFYYSNQFKTIVNGITEGYSPDQLWITTESNGVYCFNVKTGKFKQYTHTSQKQDISTNQTNCITKSYGNIIWIGTQNGLNKLDVKPRRFQLLGNEDETYGVKYNYTTAICIEKNLVFFGTKFGGVQIYDLTRHNKRIFSADKGNFPTNYITAITALSEREILIGGDGYLMIYDIPRNTFYPIDKKIPALHAFCVTNKRIKSLLLDSRKNLWIGTNFGIIFYDAESKTTKHYDTEVLPSNKITCFYENYKNKIFIGTENGLSIFDYKYDSFKNIPLTPKAESELQTTIYDITEDFNGNIWIGTNMGLVKYNPQNNNCTYFSTNDGLSSNEIFSVLTNNSDIWVGTDNGLNAFIPDSGICKSFSVHDGIQDYEFSPHAAFKTLNGYMFFGGTQGINIFHPDSIKTSAVVPNLEFLKLEYTTDDKKIEIPIKNKQAITIPWNNTNLIISFAALEFTQPMMNQYKYYLTGQTDEWVDLQTQNYINIVKLPIGDYTLKVMAANEDGMWTGEQSIILNVPPPFWQTPFATVLRYFTIALVILLFFLYSRYRVRKEKLRLIDYERLSNRLDIQKKEIESKNKNIMDSIHYAKRIQSAIMPAKAKFRQLVPDYFIFYQPKDVVSGDFYWINKIDDKIFIVCADCTGHGVPGAFMSIIGNNQLRTITQNRKIHKASEILDYLNKALIELFIANDLDDSSEVKDGMDISICVFHTNTGVLEFAGALSRMILVRNNQLIIYRGDKNPVGLSNEQDNLFTTAIIRVQEGDRFYLFSDGYADQFGGDKGKKIKFKQFKYNILSIQHLPMIKQGNELKKQFKEWQGVTVEQDENGKTREVPKWEQIDDVIVIGFDFDNYLKNIRD